ncbi:hypothetical protein [Streptomyces sp. NPDC047974]|uniref:hypothetical protein n=1 Tax=Streptomyces sp. NPDC047974 TaxID=3154343 RepID=UPI0033CFE808
MLLPTMLVWTSSHASAVQGDVMVLPDSLRRRRFDIELVIDTTTPEARREYALMRQVEERPEKRFVDFTRPEAPPPPPRRRRDDYMLVQIVRKEGGRG